MRTYFMRRWEWLRVSLIGGMAIPGVIALITTLFFLLGHFSGEPAYINDQVLTVARWLDTLRWCGIAGVSFSTLIFSPAI